MEIRSAFWMLAAALVVNNKGAVAVQSWEEVPGYTEVNPGDSAVLSCKVYNKKGTCSWQKDGKPLGIFVGKTKWAGDQTSGDCSIRILDASDIDDGEYECQVTASSFTAHDALTSGVARLVVRVAPQPPYLEVGAKQVPPSHNFTVREGRHASIKCVSRYGNPPPRMRWFIGNEELPAQYYNQSNATEPDKAKTHKTVSTLNMPFDKADHERTLRCIVLHDAYSSKSMETSASLDVQYAPTVTLQGAPTADVEENVDSVSLRCLVDSNPMGSVIWHRLGETSVFSFQDKIEFSPVERKHSGTYTCTGRNIVASSPTMSVTLDVKYAPKVIRVGPASQITVGLGNQTMMDCEAEGNPPASYSWYQVTGQGKHILRGQNATLFLDDVDYEHQGQYYCVARNIISSRDKQSQGEPVTLEVVGAPKVLHYTVEKEVEVQKGDDAVLQMVFCSDPQPSQITWEWGSLQLDAGNGKGRYVAETLAQEAERQDCYQARLRVQQTDVTDARNYYLNVRNDRGADRYAVTLSVKEPVSMTTVIGIVTSCLVILVVVILIVLYAFKTEKCCFSRLSLSPYPAFTLKPYEDKKLKQMKAARSYSDYISDDLNSLPEWTALKRQNYSDTTSAQAEETE